MKKMSPIMLTGFVAGWVATAALAGFLVIHFATAAPSTPPQAQAQATTQLVTQVTAPATAAPAPAAAAPAATPPAPTTPAVPAPAVPPRPVPTPPAAPPATPPPAARISPATIAAAPDATAPAPAEPRPPALEAAVQAALAAKAAAAAAAAAAAPAPTAAAPMIPAPTAAAPTAAAPAEARPAALEAAVQAARAAQAAAAAAGTAPPVLTPTPMAPGTAVAPATATTPRVSYANMTSGEADQGLRLNLRNVTVDQALKFLTDAAGFTINRQTQTSYPTITGTVDVVSDTPLNRDEIVELFNTVLAAHDLTAIQNKKILTIETVEDAMKDSRTPVHVVTNTETGYEDITPDAQLVTEVIPVHTLNPTQVVKDLYTLIPPGAIMNTSEAGTSVIMTAPQADVRRFAQIIAALDSTGNGDLEVFLLVYADSKQIAQELKDVFTDTGSGGGGGGGGGGIAAIFGGRGGRGGGGGGAADESARRNGVHVNAVSDDENNAVLVSAPLDYMPGISNIIMKLDIPQEDTIEIKLFVLKNADCNDVANELLAVFPDPNTGGGAANARGGRGNTMTFGGRAGGGGASTTGMSDHMKKQVTVNAVPDARTQSVLVTASKDTMTEIEKIINEMDAMTYGHVQVYVWKPLNGDVLDLAGPLQDLFQSSTGRSSSSSTQNNALQQRMQNGAQNATTTASSSVSGSTGGGGGGGGGGMR